VPDQFHLVEGVVDRHRDGGEFLLPHDVPGLVLVVIDAVAVDGDPFGGGRFEHRQPGRRLADRDGRLEAPVHAPPVRGAAQAVVQLGGGEVEGGVEVAGGGLGPDDGPPAHAGDLDMLAVLGLSRVALVEELDVDALDLLVVAFHLLQLVSDVHPVVIGYLDVATLDDDVHA